MIVLGSGMGGFEDNYEPLSQVDYSDIPNFLTPSIEGHAGKLSLVSINNKLTAILSGRAHYYEEWQFYKSTVEIRTWLKKSIGLRYRKKWTDFQARERGKNLLK